VGEAEAFPVYTSEEVASILSVIDRALPKAKGLCHVAIGRRLGLRSIDNPQNELENINWDQSTIELTQSRQKQR